ncbi:PLP-dependent aminotransferase family protein [Streptomyces iconiensis]|uniref:PLP-dependent aminotransferase family protein n=1 Tax=Streptomyces iconiensis TaxID=1384038 RepID=A0ABT7A0C3_9ACTN|nr:PLP-dependent aminotransferase family protein [Streptomyces iconiensis]MDJ1134778.1 PLP-dependent aminotransferase family protein [Streptomyces iconiensis]
MADRSTPPGKRPATPSGKHPATLDRSQLHPAVSDPALRSMNFLNEIMGRFPDAVSFAPGAPHPRFFADLDVPRHLDSFLDHLVRTRGLSRDEAQLELYQYGPTAGLINDLVADMLRTDMGIATTPEAVVITVGCQEAMFITLRALRATAEDVLLVTEPGYAGIVGAARLADMEICPVPESPDGWDVAELRAACRALRAAGKTPRAAYCVPDFANPSGAAMDLTARAALLEAADEEDLLILEDSVYGFTASPEKAPAPLKAMDRSGRVIHMGTFTKVCLPGVRVGYVVADQLVHGAPGGGSSLLAAELTAIKSMVTVNTPAISQAVIGGLLVESGGSLAERSAALSAFYSGNRRRLLEALEQHFPASARAEHGVRWLAPAGGFFVVLTVPFPVDDTLLEVSARKYGVLWTPMNHFFAGAEGGTHQMRLSFSYLDPDRIDEGVARLADFVRRQAVGV